MPDWLMGGLRGKNLAEKANTNLDNAASLARFESISVEDGRVKIVPKRTMKRALLLAVLACLGPGAKGLGGADYDPAKDPVTDQRCCFAVGRPPTSSLRWATRAASGDRMVWFIAGDQELRTLWRTDSWSCPSHGPSNWNHDFLSRFPQVSGTPHLFVLAGDGSMLHSQVTDELEAGDSYDREKFLSFLSAWAPPK